MTPNLKSIRDQIQRLRSDLDELSEEIPRWNADNIAGAKRPRSIAKRIVLSAQTLKVLVHENTYSPGT